MIGQRIRELRKKLYWTQKELGERAGIEPKNVGGYESGRLKASRKNS
ncbi:MAG: helix-turn-helix transcriptional regulator [Candidatus Competibacteraceae bacterium]|nr:helix-turn-helix transcriptional regulator [Candidatus Competibacteraceae bacterium]